MSERDLDKILSEAPSVRMSKLLDLPEGDPELDAYAAQRRAARRWEIALWIMIALAVAAMIAWVFWTNGEAI